LSPSSWCAIIQAATDAVARGHSDDAADRGDCKPPGIAVHDHIIVGKDGHASLKGLKLI
jgi:hypothetical protein